MATEAIGRHPLTAARRDGLRSIAVAVLTWPLLAVAAWFLWPELAPIASAADRLVFAVQLAVAPALLVALQVAGCARLFDNDGAENPFAGVESFAWRVNQKVLQNTVEQLAIFLPAFLALATRLEPDQVKALPVLMTLWCTGRIAFWAGYRIGVNHRSVGFNWTVFSSALTFFWLARTYF